MIYEYFTIFLLQLFLKLFFLLFFLFFLWLFALTYFTASFSINLGIYNSLFWWNSPLYLWNSFYLVFWSFTVCLVLIFKAFRFATPLNIKFSSWEDSSSPLDFFRFQLFIKSDKTDKVVYFEFHKLFFWHSIVTARAAHLLKQKFDRRSYFVLLRNRKRYCTHFAN